MPPELDRTEQLIALCDAARDISLAEREAWLVAACAGDAALQAELAALLAREASAEDWLQQPARAQFAALLAGGQHDLAGRRLGRYVIEARLGAGGMGEVWRARDTLLNRPVALKLLPPLLAADPEQIRRLQQEALAASALNHPNIITVYEIGQADGLHFIAAELVEGQTLRARLQSAPLDWRVAVAVAAQIAAALAAAHEAGIIHRDLKPENVMTLAGDRVKVLDFGVAKLTGERTAGAEPAPPRVDGLTHGGMHPGTVRYMSPEQARGEPLDGRSDIFSLGVVLYELLAGQRPYGDLHGAAWLARLTSDAQLPSIAQHCPDLPAALERSVTRALRKRREERHAAAGELQAELSELHALLPVSAQTQDEKRIRTHNANRLLTQAAVRALDDARVRLPLSSWWMIRRFADLPRGRAERAVLRGSFWGGLARLGALFALAAVVSLLAAAWLSVQESYDEEPLRDGHTDTARHAAFAPDGSRLVTVGEDRRIIVWDFARRAPLAVLTQQEGGHTDWVTTVEYSPDGRWFVTAGADGNVIVWDARRLTRGAVLPSHRGVIRTIAFSADGRFLLTPTPDDQKNLWETGTWRWLRTVRTQHFRHGNFLLAPDGNWLMMPFGEVFDLRTGQVHQDWRTHFFCGITDPAETARPPFYSWAALAPDGRHLLSIDAGGYVAFSVTPQFADPNQRRRLGFFRAHQDNGRAVAYARDGRLAASGAEDIVLWDAAAMTKRARLKPPAIVTSLAFAPQGRWLVSTHTDGGVLVWDTEEEELAADFREHAATVNVLAFAPAGRWLASAGDDRSLIVWDLARRRKAAVLTPFALKLTGLGFSADSRWLAASDLDGNVALWDAHACDWRWRQRARKLVSSENNYCAAVAPDGRWVVTSFGVYENGAGRLVYDFRDETANHPSGLPQPTEIHGAAFSADGRWLLTVTARGEVAVRQPGTWRAHEHTQLSGKHLVSVSLTPDGKQFVTGEDEGALRLWQLQPLREIGVIGNAHGRVNAVVVAPDGRQVLAGADNVVAWWDIAARRRLVQVGIPGNTVSAVAVAPDGQGLALAGQGNAVRLYTRRRLLWGWRLE